MTKRPALMAALTVLAGCAEGTSVTSGLPQTSAAVSPALAAAASPEATELACKSALALREEVNAVFVLPMGGAAIPGGRETFLSLDGNNWLCTTDARGNVNGLEQMTFY